MARHYDVETVLKQIAEIKASNPTMVTKTHLMIGFPGETAADFRKTLKAVKHFDLIFPNRFAPRIGTPAARNENQIGDREKNYRFARLKTSILARHSLVAARSLIRAKRPAFQLETL
jgi:tRNA-2-methylthio-N6-dimethylallyladenosine synthase